MVPLPPLQARTGAERMQERNAVTGSRSASCGGYQGLVQEVAARPDQGAFAAEANELVPGKWRCKFTSHQTRRGEVWRALNFNPVTCFHERVEKNSGPVASPGHQDF